MNRRALASVLLASAFLLVGFASYRIGLRAGASQAKDAFAPLLGSVQIELALNKLQRLRVLEADLGRGCSKEALAKVKFDLQTELYVLSTLYQDYEGTWAVEQLGKREPALPAQLKGFKKKHDSWTEPKCQG